MVNTFKSLCVVIVLSAVGYGAYVTLLGRTPNDPPPEVVGGPEWEAPPQVQLQEFSPSGPPSLSSPPLAQSQSLAAPPAYSSAPAYTPPTGPEMVSVDAGPTSTAPAYVPPSSAAPTANSAPAYPSTGVAAETPGAAYITPTVSLTDAPAPPLDLHGQFATAFAKVQAMLSQGQLAEAHMELSQWVENPQLPAEDRRQLLDLLDQVAGIVVYSRQSLLEPPYVVQPGDTLDRIADRYNVSWQLLAKINGIPSPQAIRPGDQLKVVRGPFTAVINLKDFELTMFLNGRYAGRFQVGIGLDSSTPEGDFSVQNKVVNPVYNGPGQTIPADSPNNPLGGRWIDLGNHIGIHGTNDPQSIGRAESRGCIRLRPADIDDVFDILSVGSRVTIRR
jgi:hypothetical protein